jgi:pyridoxal phosphate enzyme (YggS family)
MADVAANYARILERIRRAALEVGRDPSHVKLLAAAKAQNIELIHAAIEAGVKLIGENYVREAQEKKLLIREPIEWHMIGHLQRNKAKAAVEIFDLIESLDSIALAKELDRVGRNGGKKVRAFIEVNLAGEESKSGIARDQVLDLLKTVGDLSHVKIEGLMAVPPFRENVEEVRPYFRQLADLRAEFKQANIPNVDLHELSMGMTHDYTVAIEEGATIVRIGTALFGPRQT